MTNRLVINKGYDNDFIITIKQKGSVLPMIITDSDTFTCTVKDIKTNTIVASPVVTKYDKPNGKIKISLSASDTNTLVSELSDRADGYYGLVKYKIILDCKTTNNGNFIAKLNKVCVE